VGELAPRAENLIAALRALQGTVEPQG
jgi:hypothetical protein